MANSTSRGFFDPSLPVFRSWAGNLGWPILLKEMRADFRRSRFFIIHTTCLVAIAVGILGNIWLQSETERVTSVQLGRDLFDTFFLIQYLIVLIVFPAFASTAFTEERARGSFDLLITSDLRPSEVVWGKFLSTSVYCLMTVFATVPLLTISTLFGGVKFEDILAAYAILIGLTALVAMVGVFLSSCCTSNVRSTLAVYSLICPIVGLSGWLWTGFNAKRDQAGGETLVGLLLQELQGFSDANPSYLNLVWMVLGMAVLFAFLFIITTNRIRPASDERSSKLRMLTMGSCLFLLLKGVVDSDVHTRVFSGIYVGVDPRHLYDTHLLYIAGSFLVLFVSALAFCTEPLKLSRRVERRISKLRGRDWPLRIFMPGAFWGMAYLMTFMGLVTAGLLLIWYAVSGAVPEEEERRLFELTVTMPFYIFAFGALGFFLSSWGFTHGYNFLTVFFLFVITLLLPVIFWMGNRPDSVFYLYYLSPVTLYESLEPSPWDAEGGPSFVLFGSVPIIHVAKVVYGFLGVFFSCLGIYLARREQYPLLQLKGY